MVKLVMEEKQTADEEAKVLPDKFKLWQVRESTSRRPAQHDKEGLMGNIRFQNLIS